MHHNRLRFLPAGFLGIALLLTIGSSPAAAVHFPAPDHTSSNTWCDYLGTRFIIEGADAQPGDEVAFYDSQGVLCGRYVVDRAGEYGFVHVYGDDPDTATDEGASNGDILTVRVWDASEGNELSGSEVILSQGTASSFLASQIPPIWQSLGGFVLNIEASAPELPGQPPGGGGVTPPFNPPTGGGGGGGGVTPPGSAVSDNGVLSSNAINTRNITNLTILAGVTLDNSGGTLIGATNAGTIVGGSLSGIIANGGLVTGEVVLEEGSEIRGGTVTGTVTGNGTGAVLVQSLVDGAVLSNIRIGAGCILTFATVSLNAGLDVTQAVTSGAGVIDPTMEFLQGPDGSLYSPAGLVQGAVEDLLSGISVQANVDTASGTITLYAGNSPGLMVPMKIGALVVASGPDGISFTSTGGLALNRNGVLMEGLPWPLDPASFSGAMQDLGLANGMDENGISTLRLPGGTGLSFKFDIIATGGSGLSPASGAPTFSIVGNPEMPHEFTLMITYPNAASQRMPPFVNDIVRFREALAAADVPFRILPASGVIEFMDSTGSVIYRARPGYFLEADSSGATGLQFVQAGDISGDGNPDFYMVSQAGRQAIYSLPTDH